MLVVAKNGVRADIALGAMPFEERAVDRASAFAIGGGQSLTTCSAEDLVVHKAFASLTRPGSEPLCARLLQRPCLRYDADKENCRWRRE
ncbi:MAG: hypothetical protein AAB131_10475, partial [Actinomycetota bacterium]